MCVWCGGREVDGWSRKKGKAIKAMSVVPCCVIENGNEVQGERCLGLCHQRAVVWRFIILGLGGVLNWEKVRELVRCHRWIFLTIQETKIEVIFDSVCRNLWVGWRLPMGYPSLGNSDGILSIWHKSESRFICSFVGEGFLGVCLEWAPLCRRCLVVNVYSKCDLLGKQRLWENLVVLRNFYGYWSVVFYWWF